jgi:hypothetical protein
MRAKRTSTWTSRTADQRVLCMSKSWMMVAVAESWRRGHTTCEQLAVLGCAIWGLREIRDLLGGLDWLWFGGGGATHRICSEGLKKSAAMWCGSRESRDSGCQNRDYEDPWEASCNIYAISIFLLRNFYFLEFLLVDITVLSSLLYLLHTKDDFVATNLDVSLLALLNEKHIFRDDRLLE